MLGMTKAMYKISQDFDGMIELHKKEIDNHQKLIDEFKKKAEITKDYQARLVYLLEAHRNKEHQKGHIKMVDIYIYLKETL